MVVGSWFPIRRGVGRKWARGVSRLGKEYSINFLSLGGEWQDPQVKGITVIATRALAKRGTGADQRGALGQSLFPGGVSRHHPLEIHERTCTFGSLIPLVGGSEERGREGHAFGHIRVSLRFLPEGGITRGRRYFFEKVAS